MIEIKKHNTVIDKINNKKKKIILSLFLIIALMFSGNILAKRVASCTATLSCGSGGTVSCTGTRSCSVGSNYVRCDDVTATCY